MRKIRLAQHPPPYQALAPVVAIVSKFPVLASSANQAVLKLLWLLLVGYPVGIRNAAYFLLAARLTAHLVS